jgi:hypothetical protein
LKRTMPANPLGSESPSLPGSRGPDEPGPRRSAAPRKRHPHHPVGTRGVGSLAGSIRKVEPERRASIPSVALPRLIEIRAGDVAPPSGKSERAVGLSLRDWEDQHTMTRENHLTPDDSFTHLYSPETPGPAVSCRSFPSHLATSAIAQAHPSPECKCCSRSLQGQALRALRGAA